MAQPPDVDSCGRLLERSGYRKMLEDDPTPEAESRLGNLDELVTAAADAGERGETISEFLDHAALVSDADSVDEQAQVALLTMHNAKGLEFPVVFIAGLEEGLFPHSRSVRQRVADGRGAAALLRGDDAGREAAVPDLRADRGASTAGRLRSRCIPSRFLREVPAPADRRSCRARRAPGIKWTCSANRTQCARRRGRTRILVRHIIRWTTSRSSFQERGKAVVRFSRAAERASAPPGRSW